MVMNVSSHIHVRVCGKGKNIIQETEYHHPVISGEITLTHILCIHFYVFLHQSVCCTISLHTTINIISKRIMWSFHFGTSLF